MQKYSMTEFEMKDKKSGETKRLYAKDSCKKCHGTGRIGTFKPSDKSGSTVILCRCCMVPKTGEYHGR